MTREEAIMMLIHTKEFLMGDKICWSKYDCHIEALDMAIEALSADDEINEMNREIIKDTLKMMPTAYLLEALGVSTFEELTEPADAVQGWRIGKPTEQGKYMVTIDSFGHKRIDLFYYGKPMMPNRKVRGKCWYRSDDEWGDVVYDDTDILAWQPLPTPYKGGDGK